MATPLTIELKQYLDSVSPCLFTLQIRRQPIGPKIINPNMVAIHKTLEMRSRETLPKIL